MAIERIGIPRRGGSDNFLNLPLIKTTIGWKGIRRAEVGSVLSTQQNGRNQVVVNIKDLAPGVQRIHNNVPGNTLREATKSVLRNYIK